MKNTFTAPTSHTHGHNERQQEMSAINCQLKQQQILASFSTSYPENGSLPPEIRESMRCVEDTRFPLSTKLEQHYRHRHEQPTSNLRSISIPMLKPNNETNKHLWTQPQQRKQIAANQSRRLEPILTDTTTLPLQSMYL